MLEALQACKICPHHCKVNRIQGQKGNCKAGDKVEIARADLHFFEEPCISGENGSGTVFFSHCNLHCQYCQNYEISQNGKGKEVTIPKLAEIFLKLQGKGANNINLVTPTMYVYQIREALKIAKENGLHLPIIYNTNSYETIETIQALEGCVDVYLPDLKYYSDELAKKYSKADQYFETATKAILEMQKQVGSAVFDKNGMIQKGIMIRHLVLPNHLQNSKHILKWIKENMPEDIYVNVMAQYFPTYKAKSLPGIDRKLTKREYKEIENYFYCLDFQNGYIQELGDHEEEYVPDFNLEF